MAHSGPDGHADFAPRWDRDSPDNFLRHDSYNLRPFLTGSQLLYNGSVIPAIKGAGAASDASLYALRNTIDQVIATVREQFYTVILNKALIGVQEESVTFWRAS